MTHTPVVNETPNSSCTDPVPEIPSVYTADTMYVMNVNRQTLADNLGGKHVI